MSSEFSTLKQEPFKRRQKTEMSQSCVGEGSGSRRNNNSFNTNSFNNTFSFKNVNTFGITDERDKILNRISPLEPRIRHHDIRAHRVKHVGDWLLETEEYRNWLDGIRGGEPDKSTLFCYGDPGVGKTYIASLVIDRLCDWARRQNAIVACFYLDFAAQKEQSPTSILSSLLKQVVGGLETIPTNIVQSFRDQEKAIGGRRLGLAEIVEMLQDISSSRPTFICIDALDECMPEYRTKLLNSLNQILHKSPRARIFLAGRLHIRDEVEKHLAGRVVAVSITPTKDDIVRFLRAKLKENTTTDAMDKNLEEEIIKNIPETVSEIFLLVSLNIQAILRETTLHRRREKLGAITNGLGLRGAYDATIGRIKAQEGDRARLGMAAVMWISHSERPLSVDEICHALAVEIGSMEINTNNVPSIRTVLACCQGLVAVDKRSSTVRLIHFTLKEYLSNQTNLFDRPHSKMAETCLTYLNFQSIKDLSANSFRNLQGTPFLDYSSLYWGIHMRMELSDRSKYLALSLLYQFENHVSAELLWRSVVEWNFGYRKPFSALHCISYFGIAEVAMDLIRTKRWDVNQRDSSGLTPLMWAARHGRKDVVKLLLQQKRTEPDIPDTESGRTALSWAAGSGREGVVRLFLGRLCAHPGSAGSRWGRIRQALRGLFRWKYVNPDKPDGHGETPLVWAVKGGHDGVVKLLLGEKDVNPNRSDNDGRTPLSWAAKNGHDGVVKLLLGRKEVSPDGSDNNGRTPLWWAAKNGHDRAVRLLLRRKDVSPDMPGNDGQTPLSWAACNGHDGVVKLLLRRKDVSPDRPDNGGQTPLAWAAKNGHDGVVKLLLGQEDVNPDRPNRGGRTPLIEAACNGHDGVVKLLLGEKDVSPDRSDNNSQTPLWRAAKNGHDGVVKLLLRRKDVSPDMLGNDGQTALSWAACNGHDRVVKLLLRRKDVSPDRSDNSGQTPLWRAAKNGHDGVVKLLLERNEVSPDRSDSDGRTPLMWAAKNGHDRVVKLLLGRKDVSPDMPGSDGRTPLWCAAQNLHHEVVKLLLAQKGVNPHRPDSNGQTLLAWATGNGHNRLVKLLLKQGDVSSNRRAQRPQVFDSPVTLRQNS